MNTKLLLVSTALMLSVGGAMAADSFYVVRDTATKKCTVVKEKPANTTTMTVVGDNTIYKTQSEAEGAIKTTKVCTTQ